MNRAISYTLAVISTCIITAAPGIKSREAFKKEVMGKTQVQVMKIIGKPHMIGSGAEGEVWIYKNATFHPVTKDADRTTLVQFDGSRVIEVRF